MISTALSKRLNIPIYSFEQKTLSLYLWKHVIETNGTKNVLINGAPNHPDLHSIFSNQPIGTIVWDFHHYQMEDHVVMEAISYWCMVNCLRGLIHLIFVISRVLFANNLLIPEYGEYHDNAY